MPSTIAISPSLFRQVDIDLAAYPMLTSRRYIELPIRSPLESARAKTTITRRGYFSVRDGSRREARDGGDLGQSAETGGLQIHWRFPTLRSRRRRERTGRWLDERIDFVRVYGEIWKDAAPAHLVDVAVSCDSDDTHTASISYFD